MLFKKYRIKVIVIMAMLWSCERKELPVAGHDPGNVVTDTVELLPDYRYQAFYDLETHAEVKRNLKTTWDLAFETEPGGWHILLNTSREMQAARTGTSDFSKVNGTSGLNWQWDDPGGNLDSSAVGDWRKTGEVFVIDRGYNHNGFHTGYRKVAFKNYDSGYYTFRFARLNGNGDTTVTIAKDHSVNFVCFSFDNGGKTVSVEPPKGSWDLMFTQYLKVFYERTPPTTYLVTGVLLNRDATAAAVDSNTPFREITYEDVNRYKLTDKLDVIGYDWKTYNYQSGAYDLHPEKSFIVRDRKGFYYKLYFTGFYNRFGKKGYPAFELQKL